MTPERVVKIYNEMNQFQMTLARDPVSLGPKYLQDAIATLRNWLNCVSLFYMEAHIEKAQIQSDLNSFEGAYDIDYAELLAGDERVTSRANIKDREAAIKTILRDQLRDIQTKKRELADIVHVEKAINHRKREIRDTITEIREQRALIRAEIDTGSMYGDERPSKSSVQDILPDEEIDEEELSEILDTSGIDKDQEPGPSKVSTEEPLGSTDSGPSESVTIEASAQEEVVIVSLNQINDATNAGIDIVRMLENNARMTSDEPVLETTCSSSAVEDPPDEERIRSLCEPAQMDEETKVFLSRSSTVAVQDMTDDDLSYLLS